MISRETEIVVHFRGWTFFRLLALTSSHFTPLYFYYKQIRKTEPRERSDFVQFRSCLCSCGCVYSTLESSQGDGNIVFVFYSPNERLAHFLGLSWGGQSSYLLLRLFVQVLTNSFNVLLQFLDISHILHCCYISNFRSFNHLPLRSFKKSYNILRLCQAECHSNLCYLQLPIITRRSDWNLRNAEYTTLFFLLLFGFALGMINIRILARIIYMTIPLISAQGCHFEWDPSSDLGGSSYIGSSPMSSWDGQLQSDQI